MVYGLNIKTGHGYFVDVELLDGDINKLRSMDQSDDGGVGPEYSRSGRPLADGSHFPTRVKWLDKSGHPVPDFDEARYLNVSARTKALIEEIEPHVHQFFPTDFIDIKGRFLETRYWMVVCNRIDSLDREHTTMIMDNKAWQTAKLLQIMGDPIPDHIDPTKPSEMIFNLSQIGDAHMWRDKHMDSGPVWLSERMAEAFIKAELTGFEPGEREGAV